MSAQQTEERIRDLERRVVRAEQIYELAHAHQENLIERMLVVEQACETLLPPRWTLVQFVKVHQLCRAFGVRFRAEDYTTDVWNTCDEVKSYCVEGWIGGFSTTIFVCIEPNGEGHS